MRKYNKECKCKNEECGMRNVEYAMPILSNGHMLQRFTFNISHFTFHIRSSFTFSSWPKYCKFWQLFKFVRSSCLGSGTYPFHYSSYTYILITQIMHYSDNYFYICYFFIVYYFSPFSLLPSQTPLSCMIFHLFWIHLTSF